MPQAGKAEASERCMMLKGIIVRRPADVVSNSIRQVF